MNIGFIGLGKLGLPVAVGITEKGHTVYGYDINTEAIESYKSGVSNLYEPDMDNRLRNALRTIHFMGSPKEVVHSSDIVFVAVQTPHPPELDGSIRHNHVRKDFEYSFLIKIAEELAKAINQSSSYKTVAIISTVLPLTTRSLVYPAMQAHIDRPIGDGWGLCYAPSFIAMGTTIEDFNEPEFSLIGDYSRDEPSYAAETVLGFYDTIHSAPKLRMSWEEAECVKVFYNTFIGFKIIFANMIAQVCHNIDEANCDTVTDALCRAKERLISGKYLRGGMGDGGSCHPRDNLALAYLSDRLGLQYNIFDFVMTVREKQAEWLVDLMCQNKGHKVILGKTYKPNTNLTAGSPSLLISNILKERGEQVTFYDPLTDPQLPPNVPSVYLIGTQREEFKNFAFAPGSLVIDPWRMIQGVPEGVELIQVGVGPAVTGGATVEDPSPEVMGAGSPRHEA